MFLPLMLTLASLAYEPLKFTDYSFIKSDTLEVRHLVEFTFVLLSYEELFLVHRYTEVYNEQVPFWEEPSKGAGEMAQE